MKISAGHCLSRFLFGYFSTHFLDNFWTIFGQFLDNFWTIFGPIGPPWGVWTVLAPCWELLGSLLGLSGAPLGALLGRLGALLGRLGALWGSSKIPGNPGLGSQVPSGLFRKQKEV